MLPFEIDDEEEIVGIAAAVTSSLNYSTHDIITDLRGSLTWYGIEQKSTDRRKISDNINTILRRKIL